uniref:hypothetical protein n=1 Tax=Algoriphagus sp. TaxID=1872435 RepID=UPI004048C7C5
MKKTMYYEGEVLKGKLHGTGKLTAPDGETLEGFFKDGFPEGEAKLTSPNGEIYILHFSDNKLIKSKRIDSLAKPERPKKENPFEPKHITPPKSSFFPGIF